MGTMGLIGQGSRIVYFPSNYCINVSSMMPVSSKRKLDEVEEEGTSIDQRKSILDISMTKLRCSPRRKVEPSLRRSVLIFNTLKNIENQLKMEGVCVPLQEEKSNLIPAIQPNGQDVLDFIPSSNSASAQSEQHYDNRMDYCVDVANDASYNFPVCNNNSVLCSNLPQSENAQLGTGPCYLMTPSVPSSPESCAIVPNHSEKTSQVSSTLSEKTEVQQCNKSISSENFQIDSKASSDWNVSSTNSFTESLLSDTSKFILDSLLSSDKLVAVASFSSLFEVDSNSEAITGEGPNQNNNNSSSGSQIPPFSCLSNTSTSQSGISQDSSCSDSEHYQTDSYICRNVQSSHYQCSDNSNSSSQWSYYNNNSPPFSQQSIQPTTCRQESDSSSIIGDIDCNSFDFDLFLPSLSPSMKLTQLNHEDLVHSLPSAEIPFSSSSNMPAGNQKTELLSDDLDHIMQILVGI